MRRGALPPDEISPYLRHLTPLWINSFTKPLLQLLLLSLYWSLEIADWAVRLIWTGAHFLYTLFFMSATIWRMDTVVPVRQVKREQVFAMSKPLKLSDVKSIQRGFSGTQPGPSQSDVLGHGHVTVNDVLCAIMADVVSLAIQRNPEQGRLRWLKVLVAKVAPPPVSFFM